MEIKKQIKDTICNICEYWYSDCPAYETPMRCHCSGDCSQEWIIEDILKIFEQANSIQAGKDGLVTKQELIAAYYGIEVNNDLDGDDYMVERLRRIAKVQKALDESQAKQKQAEVVNGIMGKVESMLMLENHSYTIYADGMVEEHIPQNCPKCQLEAFKKQTLEELEEKK